MQNDTQLLLPKHRAKKDLRIFRNPHPTESTRKSNHDPRGQKKPESRQGASQAHLLWSQSSFMNRELYSIPTLYFISAFFRPF